MDVIRSGRDRGRNTSKQISAPRSRSSSMQRDSIHRFSSDVAKLHAAQLALGAISKLQSFSTAQTDNPESTVAPDEVNSGVTLLSNSTAHTSNQSVKGSARKSKLSKIVARAKASPKSSPTHNVNDEAPDKPAANRNHGDGDEAADGFDISNFNVKEKRLLENVQFERTLLLGAGAEENKAAPKSLLSAKDVTIQTLRKQNARLQSNLDEVTQKLSILQRDLKATSVRELNAQCETYFQEILRLRAVITRFQQDDSAHRKNSDNVKQPAMEPKRVLLDASSQTIETSTPKADDGNFKVNESSFRPSDKPPIPTGNSSRRSSIVPQDDATTRSNAAGERTSPQNSTRSIDDREREQQIARLRSMNDTLMKANAERIRLIKENGGLKKEIGALAEQLEATTQLMQARTKAEAQRKSVQIQTVASETSSPTKNKNNNNNDARQPTSTKKAEDADSESRVFQLEMENSQLRMRLAEYELRVQLNLRTVPDASSNLSTVNQRAPSESEVKKQRSQPELEAQSQPKQQQQQRQQEQDAVDSQNQLAKTRTLSTGLKSGFLSVVQQTLTDNDVAVIQSAFAAYRSQRNALSRSKSQMQSRPRAESSNDQDVAVLESYLRSHRVRKAFLRAYAPRQKPAASRRRRNVLMNGVASEC